MPATSIRTASRVPAGRIVAAACAVAATLAPVAARAAGAKLDPSGSFAIRWWTVDDGLPEASLTGVAIDADGAVWCASYNHLVRFDGRRFVAIPEPVVAHLRGKVGLFSALGFGPQGVLWIAGAEGVAVCRSRTALEAGGESGWETYKRPKASIWRPLFDDRGTPRFLKMEWPDGPTSGEPSSPAAPRVWIDCVVDPRTDDLWVWTNGDARRIVDGVPRGDAAGLEGRIINMAPGDSGLWAGLVNLDAGTVDGAAVFRNGEWHEHPMRSRPPTPTREGHICEGPDGTVWLATHTAMHALRSGEWYTVVDGLPDFSLTTQRLATDRHGALWAACKGGLLSLARTTLRTTPLPPCRVLHECDDGSLVAGVVGAVLRVAGNGQPAAGGSDVVAELPATATPTAIAEAADGTLFVGTRDWFIHAVRDGTSKIVTQTPGLPLEIRNVNALVRDASDAIWAGTDNGLAKYNAERDCFDFVPPFVAPAPLPVLGLLAEADGSLLVAVKDRGIERLAPNGSVSREVPPGLMPGRRFVRFLRTRDHTIWTAGDQGLLRWDASGHATLFGTRHGLADRVIVQLAADDSGRLWLAMRDGYLQGIRIEDLDAVAAGRRDVVRGIVLGPLDGLGEAEILGGLVCPAGGRLLATTSAGLVAIDTDRLGVPYPDGPAAKVAIRHESVAGGFRFHWADVTTNEVVLPLYQSRLVGADASWSPPGSETEREYAAIPPGSHRFEVRRLRGDAIDAGHVESIVVTVPTPVWKTGWFLAAVAAGAAGLAAVGATAVSRTLARRRIAHLEREQERHRDRARIARDIHDSLGAGLARMAMMSDLIRRTPGAADGQAGPPPLDDALDEMFRCAEGLTRTVDEIVWAVNPANDTLRRFFTFVAHDVEAMARGGDLDLRITVDDDVPDVVLAAPVRHQLCMIVREAVTNVLRHARATTLECEFRCGDDRLDMLVADDGCGLPAAVAADEGHDGLANMRARVAELGGTITIDSTSGRGTRVAVRIPIAAPAVPPASRPRLRLWPAAAPAGGARRTG